LNEGNLISLKDNKLQIGFFVQSVLPTLLFHLLYRPSVKKNLPCGTHGQI